MGKRVLRGGMPRLAVALGVTALIVLLLWGGGGSGLAGENNYIFDNYIFLPLLMKSYPPPLLEDHFHTDANNWTPYTGYWRLHPEQWYWDAGGGYQGGGYRHNMCLGVLDCEDGAHDALTMYLGGDSQEWTDYRLEAKVNLVSGSQIGVWFRGTFEDVGQSRRKFTGYYFAMSSSKLKLWQMRTDDECGDDCNYNYDFTNPMLLTEVSHSLQRNRWYTIRVEVEGSLIKCYVDDALKISHNDTVGTTFLQGTVGLWAYKASDARFDDVLVVEPL